LVVGDEESRIERASGFGTAYPYPGTELTSTACKLSCPADGGLHEKPCAWPSRAAACSSWTSHAARLIAMQHRSGTKPPTAAKICALSSYPGLRRKIGTPSWNQENCKGGGELIPSPALKQQQRTAWYIRNSFVGIGPRRSNLAVSDAVGVCLTCWMVAFGVTSGTAHIKQPLRGISPAVMEATAVSLTCGKFRPSCIGLGVRRRPSPPPCVGTR
jgi:hypothetical protein